jgi:hypothetical protein
MTRQHGCSSIGLVAIFVFLVRKLRENDWDISRPAEVINVSHSNLYKKLDQLQFLGKSMGST